MYCTADQASILPCTEDPAFALPCTTHSAIGISCTSVHVHSRSYFLYPLHRGARATWIRYFLYSAPRCSCNTPPDIKSQIRGSKPQLAVCFFAPGAEMAAPLNRLFDLRCRPKSTSQWKVCVPFCANRHVQEASKNVLLAIYGPGHCLFRPVMPIFRQESPSAHT